MKILWAALAIEFLIVGCYVFKPVIKKHEIVMDPQTITACDPPKGVSEIINGIQHFSLQGEINQHSAKQFAADISTMSLMANAYVVDINSIGGEVIHGHSMSMNIEFLGPNTYCIVDGEGDSMALYILQSCPVRLMTKRSILLLHGVKFTDLKTTGDKHYYQSLSDELRTTEKGLVEQYCGRMKPSKKEILKMIDGRDIWLDWEKALNIGAVDRVVNNYQEAEQLILHGWKPTKPPAPHYKLKHHKLSRR